MEEAPRQAVRREAPAYLSGFEKQAYPQMIQPKAVEPKVLHPASQGEPRRRQESPSRMMAAVEDRRHVYPVPQDRRAVDALGPQLVASKPSGAVTGDEKRMRDMLTRSIVVLEKLKRENSTLKEKNIRQYAEMQEAFAQKHVNDKELCSKRDEIEAARKELASKDRFITDLQRKLAEAAAERENLKKELHRSSGGGFAPPLSRPRGRDSSPLGRMTELAGRAADTFKGILSGRPPVPSRFAGGMGVAGDSVDELAARLAAVEDKSAVAAAVETNLLDDLEARLAFVEDGKDTGAASGGPVSPAVPVDARADDAVSVAEDDHGVFYTFLQNRGLLVDAGNDISELYQRIMGRQIKSDSVVNAMELVEFPAPSVDSAKAARVGSTPLANRSGLTEEDLTGCFYFGSSLDDFKRVAEGTSCDREKFPPHHFRLVLRNLLNLNCSTTKKVARAVEEDDLA